MKLTKKKIAVTLFFIATFSILIFGFKYLDLDKKSKTTSPQSKSGYFLGTYINIKIYDNPSDEVFNNVFDILKDIENKMSINISNSEVSRINQNSGQVAVKVSPETFEVIKKGKYYSDLSKGNFDISIGPLVELWGIGSNHARVPSSAEIEDAKNKINYNDILLDEDNSTVKLKNKNMIIDLGGIAKGYSADKIVEYLKSKGIKTAIIDLGGNIYALGKSPTKDAWSIGIQNPIESRGEHLGVLNINNKSVVTSGVYERFLEKDGKKYHHILNPFTGYPVENQLVSTTIVSDKSIDGDALSTTLFTLGVKDGLKFIESIEDVDAILVNSNKEVYITSGLKDKFKVTNNEYKIVN
ncbi:FAD:protein FMN transferase [Clostridium aciditolerans]|uniref:FAD:protein FMN transferase n=1 Tax=Clostridium aciditolerans TaxID=339861 RepID=A0A934M357_9CLOT|nr:FAD:protein FMN transferase [Clostridium aciditolerans]MBI6875204.1 FAD:protein FMN transferase [Clostridium aciditolerans]